MNKCIAVIEEEERKNREELYEGDASLGRRALQLVIMKKQLDQMKVELREMMVYQAPPELGALWTDVSEMMKDIGAQQKVLLTRKMRQDAAAAARRKAKFKLYMQELSYGIIVLGIAITMVLLMWWVSYDRKQRWPELEPEVIAQKREERKKLRILELQQHEEIIKKRDEEFQKQQE